MLINTLAGNPHIVEMIRLVVVNKAFRSFQKASLSERLGLQLHRIEQYHSSWYSTTAILLVSSMYGSPLWGVLNVTELVLLVRLVQFQLYLLAEFFLGNSISSRLQTGFLTLTFSYFKCFFLRNCVTHCRKCGV